jgi:hypothetical protein
LISFLPWHRFVPRSMAVPANASCADPPRMRLQPLIVVVFIAQQLIVSALSLEAGPAYRPTGCIRIPTTVRRRTSRSPRHRTGSRHRMDGSAV